MRIPAGNPIAALALALALALGACGGKASEREVATLSGDGFSVAMPGAPKRSTQTVATPAGPVSVTAYITEGGSEGFSMSVARIPSGVKGDLDGAVRGAAANVRGTARDVRRTTYQGFPARDVRIANARGDDGSRATVFARLVLARGRLYQLQFVQEGGDVTEPPAAYPRFLSSLKLG